MSDLDIGGDLGQGKGCRRRNVFWEYINEEVRGEEETRG